MQLNNLNYILSKLAQRGAADTDCVASKKENGNVICSVFSQMVTCGQKTISSVTAIKASGEDGPAKGAASGVKTA